MDDIYLHSTGETGTTSISNLFIDEYMAQANGDFIKIYIYLLRCLSHKDVACSICQIADKFEHTEKDVLRALKYWEKMKLLRLEYDDNKRLTNIYLLPITSEESPTPLDNEPADTKSDSAPAPSQPEEPVRREYTKNEIQSFSEMDEMKELFFIIENYLKRTLSATDINSILYWYDGLHFSADLIEYLVEYCVTRNHTSIRYMEKVALGWSEINITSVEQAKRSATLHNQAHFAVMKALGIKGRNLVELEMNMINKWIQEYGFTLDIIQEACNRTITATHQPSFEYTDKILSNWHKGEVHHLEDITLLDQKFQQTKATPVKKKSSENKFKNFAERTYNYDQLEQKMLNRSKS